MHTITTYTGRHIDPTDPDPACFDIRDIAHALSLTCRGNGHVKTFYSVGQHCISAAREALARGYGARIALICLLHDASEAYMSDVPRPFKHCLEKYLRMEEEMLGRIYAKFTGSRISAEEAAVLKQIDDDLLKYDLVQLLNENIEGELPAMAAEHDRGVRTFESVEAEYLRLFAELSKQV